MARRKNTKKITNKNVVLEYPIYKNKSSIKLFYKEGSLIAIKVHPLEFSKSAKYLDMIMNGEFSVKEIFKEIFPVLDDYFEIDDEASEIKLNIKQLMINDPNKNPLEFSELLELITELLKISGVLEKDVSIEDNIIENKEIGKVKVEIKPLGIMESAEATDILADKNRTQKFFELFATNLTQYANIEIELEDDDVEYDINDVNNDDPLDNPLTFEQMHNIIHSILIASKIIPGDIEKFHSKDKKVPRNKRGRKSMGDSKKDKKETQ